MMILDCRIRCGQRLDERARCGWPEAETATPGLGLRRLQPMSASSRGGLRGLNLLSGSCLHSRGRATHEFSLSACSMIDLLAARRHAQHNQVELESSVRCGCFYCLQIYSPQDIVAWSGLEVSDFENPDSACAGTALCPRCGSESVIGDTSGISIDHEFLNRMHEAWFQRTVIRRPAPKA